MELILEKKLKNKKTWGFFFSAFRFCINFLGRPSDAVRPGLTSILPLLGSELLALSDTGVRFSSACNTSCPWCRLRQVLDNMLLPFGGNCVLIDVTGLVWALEPTNTYTGEVNCFCVKPPFLFVLHIIWTWLYYSTVLFGAMTRMWRKTTNLTTSFIVISDYSLTEWPDQRMDDKNEDTRNNLILFFTRLDSNHVSKIFIRLLHQCKKYTVYIIFNLWGHKYKLLFFMSVTY